MHPEAYAGFGRMIEQAGLDRHAELRVLDVGGQNVNGTAHDYFPNSTITTLDLENADIIADASTWEAEPRFDVVMATELFEHVKEWEMVIGVMRDALDPKGAGVFLSTCASTARPEHGATGEPAPAKGEWYENVPPGKLQWLLESEFKECHVEYLHPPGDAYAWARI